MKENSKAQISIHDLSLWVNLGIRDIEKTERQEVRLSIDLNFSELPKACLTDRLEDTADYHALTRKIIEVIESRSYSMVEKMAKDVLDLTQNEVQKNTKIQIHVHKVHPPMSRVQGGISFTIKN